MDYISIWQDYFYEATGTTELTYSLYDSNDELLYMGKAVARPDYGYVRINLSRLVQNYLNSELPDVAFSGASFNAGTMVLPNALRRFYLTDDKGNELGQYYFINIWMTKVMS